MAAKTDSLKDEMDEALNKVEICKVDLVLYLSRNSQFSNLLLAHFGMLYTQYLIKTLLI